MVALIGKKLKLKLEGFLWQILSFNTFACQGIRFEL
jgi:hypothetical protein